MATIRDLAEYVGVTKAVISAYLNDPDTSRASAATKTRIDEAVEVLGYTLNTHARNLSTRRSNLVNVLVLFREPLFRVTVVNEILSGLFSALGQHDVGLVFPPQHSGSLLQMARERIRSTYGNDGYVVIGTRYSSSADINRTVDELEKRRAIFVVTNAPDLGRPVNQVLVHSDRSATAMQHLLGMGHKRVLILSGTGLDPEGEYHEKHIHSTLEQYGIEQDPVLFRRAGYKFGLAKQAVTDALDSGVQFTAVFSLARQMAMAAAQALMERNIRVPEDVAIATIADSLFLEYYHFPFVVVETDYFRMGEEAGHLVMSEVECRRQRRRYTPQTIRIESRLVVGHSSKGLPTGNWG